MGQHAVRWHALPAGHPRGGPQARPGTDSRVALAFFGFPFASGRPGHLLYRRFTTDSFGPQLRPGDPGQFGGRGEEAEGRRILNGWRKYLRAELISRTLSHPESKRAPFAIFNATFKLKTLFEQDFSPASFLIVRNRLLDPLIRKEPTDTRETVDVLLTLRVLHALEELSHLKNRRDRQKNWMH